jgi:hypothetical protein
MERQETAPKQYILKIYYCRLVFRPKSGVPAPLLRDRIYVGIG